MLNLKQIFVLVTEFVFHSIDFSKMNEAYFNLWDPN